MGQRLATLVLLTTPLGGCSLIYGPDRLPALNDAPPQDANPPGLTVERVSPAVLFEGQGDGGGRSAVLVIHGSNILAGATVSIEPHAGEPRRPSLAVDNANAVVDIYAQTIAVPIKLDVDANLGPTPPAVPSLRLDVTVTQPAPFGHIRATLGDDEEPGLTLQGLPELTGTPGPLEADAPLLYSRVDVTTLSAAAGRMAPLIVRSMSSIAINGPGTITLNASNRTAGPGGFDGGAGGPRGLLPPASDGKQGGGTGGGKPNGGGAGFATTGAPGTGTGGGPGGPAAGEASLTALTTMDSENRGSGGAGGRGSDQVVGGGDGGNGGGGGGTLELTAAGDLKVMVSIEAKGGNGTSGGNGATAGGGGSGGAVLLRAGGTLTVAGPGVVATGGDGGGTSAGKGSDGRVRVDSPQGAALTIPSMPAVGYRGPMLSTATPLIVREATPKLTFAGHPDAVIKYTIEDGEGSVLGPIELTLPGNGELAVKLAMPLFPGFNRLCALVTSARERIPEAQNCITLAYLR